MLQRAAFGGSLHFFLKNHRKSFVDKIFVSIFAPHFAQKLRR